MTIYSYFRVIIPQNNHKRIGDIDFESYGAHFRFFTLLYNVLAHSQVNERERERLSSFICICYLVFEMYLLFWCNDSDYPHTYLTMACTIGQTKEEIDRFFERFEKTMKQFKKKRSWNDDKQLTNNNSNKKNHFYH
jgi:hypothetical protein